MAKCVRRSTSGVRTTVIVLLMLIMTPLGAVASDSSDRSEELQIEGSDIISSYSRAVQLAFDRVSNLDSYSNEELEQTEDWLVVTRVPIGKHKLTLASPDFSEPAPILIGSYIWKFFDSETAIARLQMALEAGEIESFSPLVEKQQYPRLVPNDPEFSSQWHLSNSGQTSGGLAGEDINVTSVWDTYTGSGIVISVIDDGLDHNHSDINPHYSPTLSYDWCDDDGDPILYVSQFVEPSCDDSTFIDDDEVDYEYDALTAESCADSANAVWSPGGLTVMTLVPAEPEFDSFEDAVSAYEDTEGRTITSARRKKKRGKRKRGGIGRSIRNEEDEAITYILDSDWERIMKKCGHMFPSDFFKSYCEY